MRKIILAGASGSIGRSAIDVIQHLNKIGFDCKLVLATANRNEKFLLDLKNKFQDLKIGLHSLERGRNGILSNKDIEKFLVEEEWDVFINAVSGFAGFKLTYLVKDKEGKRLALANKESVAIGGKFLKDAKIEIFPVDSEHSAIYQSLLAGLKNQVKHILLTASGGALRNWPLEKIEEAKSSDLLNHPNWDMGNRITIDSATMFNKFLELVEAVNLFDIDIDRIKVLMHKQSIIHSAVTFVDNSTIAQLSIPDMRLPIQYAITYPDRVKAVIEDVDWEKVGKLEFFEIEEERYPIFFFSLEQFKKNRDIVLVLNAVDEVLIENFVNNTFTYGEFIRYFKDFVLEFADIKIEKVEELLEFDLKLRQKVNKWLKKRL